MTTIKHDQPSLRMGRKCPACKSKRVWKKGKSPTRQGDFQRYVCFTCGRTFYAPGNAPTPRVSKYVIDPYALPTPT